MIGGGSARAKASKLRSPVNLSNQWSAKRTCPISSSPIARAMRAAS